MLIKFSIIIFASIFVGSQCVQQQLEPGENERVSLQKDKWFGQKWLDKNYLLKWKTNHLKKVMTFRVEVMTKGWVGFGFSKHGKSNEIDLNIGWIDKWGKSTFNDFWINEFGVRSLDMSQDWTLLYAEENATHTSLEFSRHHVTCDETNDLEIYENEIEYSNVVFAYSFLDPVNIENIGDHNFEGQFYINFFEKPEINEIDDNPDIEIVDHWLNVSINPMTENTQCALLSKIHQQIHQIIKYQIIAYPSFDQIKLHHHFGWYECEDLSNMEDYLNKVFPCYDPTNEYYFIRRHCSKIIMATYFNNNTLEFPNDVGITIDPAKKPYFLLEGHLKNPLNKLLHAKLSYRLWLIKQPRHFEASYTAFTATAGLLSNTWGFIVPPKQQVFRVSLILSTYCFGDEQVNKGIFIFQVVFHSHHGKRMEIRHYRDDKLIRVIPYNNYDSYYQPYRQLKVPINLQKKDKFVVICDYSSMNETKSYTSPQEHCVALVYYYPFTNIKNEKVYSSRLSYEKMLKITGLEQIDGYDTELVNNIIIRKPIEYNNTKLIDFISENKYKIKDPKELEEFQISSDLMECCYVSNFWYTKDKPCRQIKKPPGLYKSLLRNRKSNSCPLNEYLKENKSKILSTNERNEKLKQIVLTFKSLIKIFN